MLENDFLKSLNVLYVEDELETAKKFSSILRRIFKEVFFAPNGEEALKIYNKNSINLIISDINMPKLDGLEMSKKIRELDKNIPIILITARNESESLLQAIELNIDSYILKPISLEDFISKIDSVSQRIEAKENLKILDQYKKVVDDNSIVIKFSLDGKITYVNKKYLQITGYKKDEIIGNYFNFNQHKDEPSSLYLKIWETLDKKRIWTGKQKNLTKLNNEYILESKIFPIIDINGNTKEYIQISNDITDQETLNNLLNSKVDKYEENLTDKTQLLNEYKKSLDKSTAIVKLNKDFKIIDINTKFLEILDLKRREIVNRNFFEFVDASINDCTSLFEKLDKREFYQSLLIFKNDNSKKHIKTSFSTIVDSNNNLKEYLIFASDLTEILTLQDEIKQTQKDVIFTLGTIGEKRSKETGNHVKRVSKYAYIIAKKLEMKEEEAKLIEMAAPMHDIGKVAISDSILNKPGKLTKEEFEIMKTHTTIGYEMLKNSNRDILKASSIIAYEHHEKWDGSGYPRGLRGEEIHIYGRILSVADTFDALGTKRCYKEAWKLKDILSYMNEKAEKDFDPKIIKILNENIEDFVKIKEIFEDK